ncbi:MAG: DUF2336 domain-containing protein [Alphaproteobacteria bacterium]|nr:DUF2336 domain-containing protein [Alphaproteobacteria bacterium]
MLKWMFGGKKKSQQKAAPDYEQSKQISATGDAKARQKLAAHEGLQPEFLYYFATDKAPEVRRSVAANTSTPLQADVILSRDPDEQVRSELGRKIGALLPDLSEAQGDRVKILIHQIVETLAKDEMPRVRAVIAEEIKLLDNIPPRIAKMLAEDAEAQVAAPILQYSPLLSGDDILEIVSESLNAESLVAVARRDNIEENVVRAVIESDETLAITALLENKTALIGDSLMDKIVDLAEPRKDMHEPLVSRGGLSSSFVQRIAGFVSASLLDPLIKNNSLVDDELAEKLRESVAKRLTEETPVEEDRKRPEPQPLPDFGGEEAPEFTRAKQMHEKGELTAKVFRAALEKGETLFLAYGLCMAADVPAKSIEKVFETQNAKSIMAIAWHCELGVEFAVNLQRDIWEIPEVDIVQADENGGYPMSEANLEWAYSILKE